MTVTDDLTEFRGQYRLWRHLLLPGAAAVVLFLFRLCGILHPRLHAGEPAAFRSAWMAMPWRYRWRPAGQKARTP